MEDTIDSNYNHAKKVCRDFELNPVKLVLAPGLAWQANCKKTKVELELLSDAGY